MPLEQGDPGQLDRRLPVARRHRDVDRVPAHRQRDRDVVAAQERDGVRAGVQRRVAPGERVRAARPQRQQLARIAPFVKSVGADGLYDVVEDRAAQPRSNA